MIPSQLKGCRFNRVRFKDKRAFEAGWQNKPYSYNEILNFFPTENYGIMCGSDLRVLDDDTEKKGLIKIFLDNFGETFRVRDHLYFRFDNGNSKKIIFMNGKYHLGELQGEGQYVVGAGSTHPSGEIYEIKNNSEIVTISYDKFLEVFGEFIKNEQYSSEKTSFNINDDDFIKSIKEKWVEGNRQDLAMSLAGYLRKERRLGLQSCLNVIEGICIDCNDNEISSRLASVRATYDKDECDIKGYSGLKEKEIELDSPNVVLMSKFSPVPFANELLKYYKFVYDKNQIFWRYDFESGLWKTSAEQFIRTILRNKLMGDEQQKRNYIEEIISYIKDITYNENFKMNNNPYFVAFKNKVFDIKKGEFIEFSPELYLTNKINLDIDENIKECPFIDKFFSDCVGEEFKQIIYDLFAYTLFKEMPYQKLFFIYGPAGTGKSKCLDLLEYFLGKDNYCSVEPRNIQKDKHATASMLYKLANIVSDINYDEFDNINQVKKLTGGDTVSIRQMYKESYKEKLFVKQIYSTNKMPIIKEKTNAWYRRVYPIEFSNIIHQDKRDPYLSEKLKNEMEIKGLTYKCLESLKKLYENKFIFTFDINESEMGMIYEELSNPVLMFINENCNINRGEWLYKFEFEERLNNWLKNNHFPVYTKSQINQYMNEYYSESNRPSENDITKVYRVWVGLGWKTSKNDQFLNHFNHFNHKIKKLYTERKSFITPPFSVKSVKS